MPAPGQSIFHEKRKKTIARILKNTKGEKIIEWESNKPGYQIGICTLNLWNEWHTESMIPNDDNMYVGKKKEKRRGLTVIRYK